MRVGESFAVVMGQELRFDELNGRRDEEEEGREEGEEGEVVSAKEEGEEEEGREDGKEGEEEGDLLEPLDLSDDEADLAATPPPRYLRRFLDSLRLRDEEDACVKITAALNEAASLIRRRPVDLPDLCVTLTRELLTMENRFNFSNFQTLKEQALVALIATVPDKVGPVLSTLAYDTNMSLGTRLDALELLRKGARDLGGFPVGGRDVRKRLEAGECGVRVQGKRRLVPEGGKGEIGISVITTDSASNGSAISSSSSSSSRKAILESKTRRWGYRRHAPPAVFRNHFAPVAAQAFFRPLLHEMIQSVQPPSSGPLTVASSSSPLPSSISSSSSSSSSSPFSPTAPIITPLPPLVPNTTSTPYSVPSSSSASSLWARDEDQALFLSQTLHTLATFVEISGPTSLGTSHLASDLLMVAWPFHLSRFPELRRAVLLAVACALTFIELGGLGGREGGREGVRAVMEWVVVTEREDPDVECRNLAGLLMGTEGHRQRKELGLG
eukprot:evm.model.NODE_37385_length_20398_cov_24.877586.3